MKNYYFIGIKGAGVSALALLLHEKGYSVQGSDTNEYIFTQEKLLQNNINIFNFGEIEKAIDSNTEIIVGNSFNPDNNIDYRIASRLGLKIIKYTDFLSNLSEEYLSIAISGTHGKTSTTNILSQLDWPAFTDISYIIGDGTGGNKRVGNLTEKPESLFLFEACEYKNNFLNYSPKITIITNIDFDHPDVFRDIEDTKSVFRDFLKNTKEVAIINGDDENVLQCIEDLDINLVKFGFSEDNDAVISNVCENNTEMYTMFDLEYKKQRFNIYTPFFGKHNIMNVAAALVTNLYLNGVHKLPGSNVIDLKYLNGARRRFQETPCNKAIIIDDYGHHPTEIRVTLEACRKKYPQKKIIAIFQPHTINRFETFLNDFKSELSKADHHFITDIYSPENRENKIDNTNVVNPTYSSMSIRNIEQYKDAVYLFLSAGNIEKYKSELVSILS